MSKHQDRILTLHPAGKQGVNIERAKYDAMKRALLKVVPRRASGVPFRSLREAVEPYLDPAVFGPEASRTWYVTVVKQDLEARGLLEQVSGSRPQCVRRVTNR